MDLFNLAPEGMPFKLHSGGESFYKIDCDALSEESIKALAKMISVLVGPFGSVEGVPRGGLKLAQYLSLYRETNSSYHLIVDDVLTTGKSMIDCRRSRIENQKMLDIKGGVIFARGPCPSWIKPLFSLPKELWG